MSNTTSPRLAAGFVLMDALIAVVVLVTGILALTLLQITMLRSAAEARERSVGMNVAQNVLEERRASAQQTSMGYENLVSLGTFSAGGCDFGAAGTPVPPNTTNLPSTYRYCVEVQRFRSNGTTFVPVASSGTGAPAYGGVVPEFKQVTVLVGWRDSQGNWASLELGDAQSSIALINSNDLFKRPLVPSTLQGGPQIKYALTDLTQNTNFIPIAMGDPNGTQSAATNPTPKVIGGGVAETSFQVFTYSASAGLANVQRQIDTRVVGCKCTSRNAPSLLAPDLTTGTEGFLTRPVRASYWDGARYTEPKGATYPTSDLIGTENSAFADGQQSPFCDLCCRDHHDPASVAAGDPDKVPRFDPYRASHVHYSNPVADTESNRITVKGQNYEEVCRVIRVNGIYRVAQDPLLDHYAYIPTDNNAVNFTIDSAKVGYGNFVQSYIQTRVLPLAGYNWATNRVNVTALEDANSQNDQAASPIDIGSLDRRYLQNRSILLDVLSKEAKDAMAECVDQTGSGAPSDLTCALRHTSFASINLTELTRWAVQRETEADSDPVTISPKNFSVTTPTGTPVAGQVRDASGTDTNAVGNALATINRSIATLADRLPVFFQNATDTFWPASDGQQFRYVGGTRPSFKIYVTVTGLSYFDSRSGDSDAPYIGWFNGSNQGDCPRDTNPLYRTRFVCDLYSSANAANVSIRMFNFHQQLPPKGKHICPASTAPFPRCNLFRVNMFTGPGTIGLTSPAFRTASSTGKPRDDEATASLGTVVDGNAYSVAFEASTSNPFKAPADCDALTGQPVFRFQDQECRR